MSFEFPRPNLPIAEGGTAPMNRSWLQWLRDFVGRVSSDALKYIGAVTYEPTGFVNRIDSTIAFDGATRTLTIAPATTSYDLYVRGERFRKAVADTVTIADTTGAHYVYFDSTGTLVSSVSAWAFTDPKAFVAIVYWRAGGVAGILMDERHGIAMDWATHEYLHDSVSMRYGSGLAGSFAASNTFSMTAGVVHDEDIEHDIDAATNCRILYRDGAGQWTYNTGGAAFYLETGGVIQYDDGDGTTADVQNTRYVAYWIYATNDVDYPIWSIPGQRTDTTLANARANNLPSSLVVTGLPSPEMKLLYRVIVRRNGAAENIEEATDYRNISSLPVGSYVATQHASLSGLEGPHIPVGGIIFANMALADIASFFDTSGTATDGLGLAGTSWYNYAICNGNNGTPNLEAKFLRMRNGATGAGGTGGNDSSVHKHSVDVAAFTGTSGNESSHTHGSGSLTADIIPDPGTSAIYYDAAGSGSFAYDSKAVITGPITSVSGTAAQGIHVSGSTAAGSAHSHSIDHDHLSVDSADGGSSTGNMPAYYELLPVMRVA